MHSVNEQDLTALYHLKSIFPLGLKWSICFSPSAVFLFSNRVGFDDKFKDDKYFVYNIKGKWNAWLDGCKFYFKDGKFCFENL